MTGLPSHDRRLRLLALLFLAGWAGLVYRLTDIQILRASYFSERADNQHHSERVLPARRGEIIDSRGRLLAADRLLHTVGVHPRYIEDRSAVAELLTRLLGGTRQGWETEIAAHHGFFYTARQVDLAEEPPRPYELPPGLQIEKDYRRTYPERRLAASVLGYTGIDRVGLEGLERIYDARLRGHAGRLVEQVDALGIPIPGREIARDEPVEGSSIRLTLDATIQAVLEEELAAGIGRSEAASGCAVALDPRTGAVLAMTAWPGFDPNTPETFAADVRRNRTITDPFEPGSVLKVVTFTAALDAGRYTPADTIDGGNGVIQVVGSQIRDVHAHGLMSLGEVLGFSSNVGTVQIARAVGENRIYRYARDFGFGQPCGLGLPGEEGGVLRRVADWYGPALESLSIGYGVSVTALQIASAYAAVANGGTLMRPWLVEAVRDVKGRWHSEGGPTAVRRIMHEETSAILRGFLREAVLTGTGERARVAGLDIAGKTGTARKAGPDGYETGRYISSFCGFLPADTPAFLLLVVVDEPSNRYYASDVAAPIFARSVQRLACHPARPLPGLHSTVHRVVDAPRPMVPDLRRRPAAEAGRALTRRGLRVRFVGTGPTVQAQEPTPLTQVEEGSVVVLHLTAPVEPEATADPRMPDLRGLSLREAAAEASALGLVLSVEGSGLIRHQSLPPGRPVSPGTEVLLSATPGGGRRL